MFKKYLLLAFISVLFVRCSVDESGKSKNDVRFIKDNFAKKVKSDLIDEYGQEHEFRINKGVEQVVNFCR
ncbi:MAG: hypothetical protein ACLFUH_03480 [Bacteroidales bacterium]